MKDPACAVAGEGYVVLEHDGLLWGVAGRDVRGLGRPTGALPAHAEGEDRAALLQAVRLTVAGGDLAADRVLAVVPDLVVRPAPGALEHFWPEVATGLAIYAQRPVLVIDGERPPRSLVITGEDAAA